MHSATEREVEDRSSVALVPASAMCANGTRSIPSTPIGEARASFKNFSHLPFILGKGCWLSMKRNMLHQACSSKWRQFN